MSGDHNTIDVVASEYVMGLLSLEEAAAFEARMADDASLRSAVAAARDQFLELDLTAEPQEATGALWGRIASRLDQPEPSGVVVPLRARASVSAKPARGFWSGVGAASLAAGLVAAVATAAVWPKLATPQPSLIVVLLDAQAKPGAIIEAFANDKVRVVPLENFVVPEGRVIQVWTLPDAKTGPVSLGLLPKVHEATLSGPSLPKPKADQLYEFTLEPAGGSPTGRPTGPILAKGFAKQPI